MQKILVSSCLLGELVRYDGKNKLIENSLLNSWIENNRVMSFCPEVSGGLPVPRIAAEIIGGDGNNVLAGSATVVDKVGNNVTDEFLSGAQQALSLCKKHNITIAILSKRSPSCGNKLIYDGSFNNQLREGAGVTAALLQQNGIRVFNQSELEDAARYIDKQQQKSPS